MSVCQMVEEEMESGILESNMMCIFSKLTAKEKVFLKIDFGPTKKYYKISYYFQLLIQITWNNLGNPNIISEGKLFKKKHRK